MSSSFEIIIPYIKPLEALLLDPTVTEVMVNAGGRRVFVERAGRLEEVLGLTIDEHLLNVAIETTAGFCGDDISVERPLLQAKLEGGSRVSAAFRPASSGGSTLTIRKFTHRHSMDELVASGSLPREVARLLQSAVVDQKNILISGGTGTGKTTMLNALAVSIPRTDRILLIEDTSEIYISEKTHHVVPFEARRESLNQKAPMQAVTIGDLLRHALRNRPDRIILGEVLGPEAWDLLHALNTGHRGSLSTIHGNNAEDGLTALADYVLMSRVALPYPNILRAVARAIQLVVHIERFKDGTRCVTQVLRTNGYDAALEAIKTEPVYEFTPKAAIPEYA